MLAAFVLSMWGLFSHVRITVRYGPTWWIASGLLVLVLTIGFAWLGRQLPAPAAVQETRSSRWRLLALTIGMIVEWMRWTPTNPARRPGRHASR